MGVSSKFSIQTCDYESHAVKVSSWKGYVPKVIKLVLFPKKNHKSFAFNLDHVFLLQ